MWNKREMLKVTLSMNWLSVLKRHYFETKEEGTAGD
jgi:hypothetical protein